MRPLKRYPKLYYFDENGRRIKGKNPKMRGNCSRLWGDCSDLEGECSGLEGNCTGLSGDCSGLVGNLDEISMEERKEHPEISHWAEEEKNEA